MEEGIRAVFGRAVTAANIQAIQLGFTHFRQSLCYSFAVGFDSNEDVGQSIFSNIKNSQKINSTLGFGSGSIYQDYEDSLRLALVGFSDLEIKVFALIANAIIFGYVFNTNLSLALISRYIGRVLSEASSRITFSSPFESDEDGNIIHPFTESYIKSFLTTRNYTLVYGEINASEKESELDLVNYNWYNTSGLFAGPNLQLMKDCENQYYYVSGKFLYPDVPTGLPPCEEISQVISTLDGDKKINRYKTIPCQNVDGYIGPPQGTEFYRIFNDGPYSSGDFTDTIKEEYISFDKELLSGIEYSNNSHVLTSFFRNNGGSYQLLTSAPIFVDANGRIDFETEYKTCSTGESFTPNWFELADTGCFPKYQVMHIGNTGFRAVIVGCNEYNELGECIDPICDERFSTGLKFIPLHLNKNIWSKRFKDIKTNTQTSTQSMAWRALNIEQNPYVATEEDSKLQTYTMDSELNKYWYIGPPQFHGGNTLPYLAFYQNFDSKTFNKFASITLFAATGIGNGTTDRSWSINLQPITNGNDTSHYTVDASTGRNPKASFVVDVFSSGNNNTQLAVFGMGNSIGGDSTVISYNEESAGYQYTGYVISGIDGVEQSSSQELIDFYSNFIIGSKIKNVRYISGYTGDNQINLNRMFAEDEDGNRYEYYYFDNRMNPISIPQTGWNSFAPLPELDNSGNYGRIYAEQFNENYFPRFQKGPYAVLDKKILYPKAESSRNIYPVVNGFPLKVKFKVRVREQAIKECFSRYPIINGVSSSTPQPVNVIRPKTHGFALGQPRNLFDGAGNPIYDFNLWSTDTYGFKTGLQTNMVNNLWSPYFDCVGSPICNINAWSTGRNGHVYNNNPTFKQGILLTGVGAFYQKRYTGLGGLHSADIVRSDASVGLYNYYTGKTITGFMRYTKPVFSLKSGIIDPTDAGKTIPESNRHICNDGVAEAKVSFFKGKNFVSQYGQDPIYLEYINGRSGGLYATEQGGYHSKGIIGDRWMFYTGTTYGKYCPDDDFDFCSDWYSRSPDSDYFLILINSHQDSTTIHTRAVEYTPFVFGYVRPDKFISGTSTIPNNKSITTKYNSKGLHFDLGSVFNMKIRAGTGFHQTTPLILGPFDRDIEIYTINPVTGYSTIYFDDVVKSDYLSCSSPTDCYSHGQVIAGNSVLKLMASGESLKINVASNFDCQDTGSLDSSFVTEVGIKTGSYLYIKPREVLLEEEYDGNFGESHWDGFRYDQNGMESSYSIPHVGGFKNLLGAHEFVVYTRSGKLYPKPEDEDFNNYKVIDALGNATFPTVEEYWENFTSTGSPVYASGWREGARISFQFEEIEVFYDDFPYDSHSVVIPSGKCTISGEMGYYGQADNSVFSEGVYLVDNSPNRELVTGFYGPNYFSPVLRRVPTFQEPSGTFNQPIEEAPSKMIQRENKLLVTFNQNYIKLNNNAPYNYNKFDWPALSDLKILNPDETIEALPPDDGNTFLNSTILICASQGQKLVDGTNNPDGRKIYDVKDQYQIYDSVATDPLINSGYFITRRRGTVVRLEQPESGYLASKGSTINNIKNGLT